MGEPRSPLADGPILRGLIDQGAIAGERSTSATPDSRLLHERGSMPAQVKVLERLVDQQGYDGTGESHQEDASSRYGDQVN